METQLATQPKLFPMIESVERPEIPLWPFQRNCANAIILHRQENPTSKIIYQMATGLGKTRTFAYLIKYFKQHTLLIAHRKELLEQAKNTVMKITGCPEDKIDIILQSKPQPERPIHIASIETLIRRDLNCLQDKVKLGIIDECHHALENNSYGDIMKQFPIFWIGCTATPTRRTGKEKQILAKTWDRIIFQYPIKKGVIEGYLARPDYYQIKTNIDISDVPFRCGDFAEKELSEKVNVHARNQACVDKYLELEGGKCLIFCVDVEHSKTMQKCFAEAGIKALQVDGTTPVEEREQIFSEFYNAKFRDNIILSNCLVATEGYDCPSIRMIIDASPTGSALRYIQKIGRGTRLFLPEKNKIIIVDLADNCKNPRLCNCLKTVFNLSPKVTIEGDILQIIEEKKKKIFGEREYPDRESEQENIALELASILFDMPIEFEQSDLAWFSPNEKEYFCYIDKTNFLKVEDNDLSYILYQNRKEIAQNADCDKILAIAQKIAEEKKETFYCWSKKARKGLSEKPVSEKQRDWLKKVAPGLNPDLISRETASQILSAHTAKRNAEPVTIPQRNCLTKNGYGLEAIAKMSKWEARKLISQIFGQNQ